MNDVSKLLFVVRHAKSSWKDESLPDIQRPLKERGQQDASRMGQRLAGMTESPELIVCSPAVRALTTARIMAGELGIPEDEVVVDERIYRAAPETLLDVVHEFNDTFRTVMLIGHNPELTELVNGFANVDISNVPTCGVAVLRFDVDRWREAVFAAASLLDFDYPKKGR